MRVSLYLTAVLLGIGAAWLVSNRETVISEVVNDWHSRANYQAVGAAEYFCVKNQSSVALDVAAIRTQIAGFLNDSSGWEQIGTAKVDFIPLTSCGSEVYEFIFLDHGASPLGNSNGVFVPGTGDGQPINGHSHPADPKIYINAQGWQSWPTEARRGVINHEAGHALGAGHSGPNWGQTNNGGRIWNGVIGQRPGSHEILNIRDHLDDYSPRAISTCAGFPAVDKLVSSWFDTAHDDQTNLARFYRQTYGGSTWTDTFTLSQGSVSGVGERIVLTSGTRNSDIAANWKVRPEVTSDRGRTNLQEPVQWSPVAGFPAFGGPPTIPCTVLVKPGSQNLQIHMSWVDASFSEVSFRIYYAEADYGWGSSTVGQIGTWQLRGSCAGNTTACVDTASSNGCFPYTTVCISWAEKLCVKIRAENSYGLSGDSNISCTEVPGAPSP